MTRSPHDQFAKQYLAELLSPLGEVQISREVAPEVRQVDLWFAPAPQPSTDPQILGLLGKIAASACVLEPFRNPPVPVEVRNCLLKLFSLHSELLRKARRENNTLPEADFPRLWILSPSCSQALLDGFAAKFDEQGNWLEGVYFLAPNLKTALVAINQLPTTQETLWLRLLGRGATQRQAVNELDALPENHPLKRNILELLTNWRINLETSHNLNEEDRELLMNLSPAYLQWREDTLREGQRLMVENLLEERFGSIDEQLSRIVEPLMQLTARERIHLLLTLSREQLLDQFER